MSTSTRASSPSPVAEPQPYNGRALVMANRMLTRADAATWHEPRDHMMQGPTAHGQVVTWHEPRDQAR
ncbi:hypothetical protein ACFVYD_10825 [Streptomyces sp. NPDC058301]|uniref:hypothetical protein n=1 Tax=Streptomyces sp. NPDC058301 TaxID=3346436 RepID=UPI0036E947E5